MTFLVLFIFVCVMLLAHGVWATFATLTYITAAYWYLIHHDIDPDSAESRRIRTALNNDFATMANVFAWQPRSMAKDPLLYDRIMSYTQAA